MRLSTADLADQAVRIIGDVECCKCPSVRLNECMRLLRESKFDEWAQNAGDFCPIVRRRVVKDLALINISAQLEGLMNMLTQLNGRVADLEKKSCKKE